ncbi:MAG: DUF2182 domain-containing protein, partial [Myxococcota bacterium]
MLEATPLEVALRRDRVAVVTGVFVLAALAWTYTALLAMDVGSMDMGAMATSMTTPQIQEWARMDFILMFVMWTVMMAAMMVPAATPMLLVFANVNRRRREQQRPFVATGFFAAGYLIVWTVFSLLATLANWTLHLGGLLSSMMGQATPLVGGFLLIAAGLFQWTRLKYVCLEHCRSPLGFLMADWREGSRGALLMGLHHGVYCLGCCWVLMALLFVLGVMNLP